MAAEDATFPSMLNIGVEADRLVRDGVSSSMLNVGIELPETAGRVFPSQGWGVPMSEAKDVVVLVEHAKATVTSQGNIGFVPSLVPDAVADSQQNIT